MISLSSHGVTNDAKTDAEKVISRRVKGVMRAGLLANGLLMKGEVKVHLVLLSADKPTELLLKQLCALLPHQLNVSSYT